MLLFLRLLKSLVMRSTLSIAMLPQQFLLLALFIMSTAGIYVNENATRASKLRFYPKNSVFRKDDLMSKGCVVFISGCPAAYKRNLVCARHYDGYFKTFNNYCELEYENCNGWRQWSMIKRDRC